MTRARIVRGVVIAVCVAGIAGMIAASVGNDDGLALTFGLVTAAAVVCLMVATAVTASPAALATTTSSGFDERQAERVEALVQELVARGVPEQDLRTLVRAAVRLGGGDRSNRPSGREIPHIGAPDADY